MEVHKVKEVLSVRVTDGVIEMLREYAQKFEIVAEHDRTRH